MGRALSVIGVPTGAGPYTAALEGLTALNEYILRANPGTPRLYDAGVRYTKEATDQWRDLTKVLATGSGDCEALSTWRSAELRVSGEDPNASVVVYKTGPSKYHAIVLRGDGTLEDPSVKLGMKPPSGLLDAYDSWNLAVAMAPKQEDQPMVMGHDDDLACAVIGANDEPHNGEVVCIVVGTDEGFKGQIRIPLSDGRAIFGQTSTSKTKGEAKEKAHRVLGVIGSFWDDLAALVPSSQAQAAIRIAKNTHVQNIAKDAYSAGKKALGLGNKAPKRPVFRTDPIAPDAVLPPGADPSDTGPMFYDDGQGSGPYDDNGLFDPSMAADVVGSQLVEMNGVLCGVDEVECLGHINHHLAQRSTPHVGAFAGLSKMAPGGGGARGGGGGGMPALRPPGAAQAPAGFHAAPLPTSSPMLPVMTPPSYSPVGVPFGSPYASPYGSPYGANPQSARAAALMAFQRQQQANAMLSQPGGGGGGGGGYGGGTDYDGGYTAADAATAAQQDADLFNAYYYSQAFNDAQNQYFNTAQEVSPDYFFGAINPYVADQMLQDDSIPAQ